MGAPFFWDERPHPSLRRHLPQRGRQGRGSRGAALLDNHGADVPPKPSPLWGRCRRRRRSVLPRKKSSLGVCTAKGSRGRPQSPLVAPAGAIPPATKKTSSKRTTSLDAGRSRPFGATKCKEWVKQLGAHLRMCKVTGRDASLPAPLLGAFGEMVTRGTVGALPQTPQGSSAP